MSDIDDSEFWANLLEGDGDGDGHEMCAPDLCPSGPHRGPEGPNEDLGCCPTCGSVTFHLRPEGETFGWHADDCSLDERHNGHCQGGGGGHRSARTIRGFWPGRT